MPRFPLLGRPPRPGWVRPRPFLSVKTPEPPTPSTVAVRRSYPPDKIALAIKAPSGQRARWAEDEPRPENILSDIEFGDEIPGGYKDLTGTLGRNPQIDWKDLEAYGEVYAYQPGVSKVWEGSVDKTPDVSGDQMSITPSMLGYQAVLEDNQAAEFGGINADLSKWGEISAQLRINNAAIGIFGQAEISTGFKDAGGDPPAVIVDFTNVEAVAGKTEQGEACFYADGLDIGRVMYDFRSASAKDPTFLTQMILCSDDVGTSPEAGTNHEQESVVNQKVIAAAAGKKYAFIVSRYNGAFVGSMTNIHRWGNVKVLGKHELEPKGVWPSVGLTAKQMVEYVIPNLAAPLTVSPEYIDDDGFIIAHAWYGDGSSVAEIIKDILKYSLYDWFVYHGKRFEVRKPGTYGKFWKAYLRESQFNEVGLDSQRLWRSIVVRYTDIDGTTRTVGPPGSGANVTSTFLEVTDPDHPAVKANRTRRDILDLQGVSTAAGAIEVGRRFLEEANLLPRSGSATLSGYVMDQYGVFWPAACVKSGDWISPVDAADRSYRKIVNKSYRHSDRASEIDIDAPSGGLEELLERLQAGLISLGVS